MSQISNRAKRLVAELTVLICIVCFWVVKSEIFGVDDVKAGVLEQVVKADSNNVDAYRFLAGYYMDSGSNGKASEALREVIRIDPNDAVAHSMLGDAYWNCGRYEEAIAAYKQAMKLRMDAPHVRYQIALAYLKMGNKDSALEEHKILKEVDEELADELLSHINE
jgi:cytochrome c-type biogenesis protein CcmH/NrfG